MISRESAARELRLWSIRRLWVINVFACALLCGRYVSNVQPGTGLAVTFLQLGRISCAATLSLVPGLLLLACARWVRSLRALGSVSALLWTLLLSGVFVDTLIYGIFRYHFNGMVWNVLTTPGAEEAVHLSRNELGAIAIAVGALLAAEYGAWLLLLRLGTARPSSFAPWTLPTVAWGAVIVPSMLTVAGVHAYSDLMRDSRVMAFARVYPLYPRLKIKRFAEKHLRLDSADRPRVAIPSAGILLEYPKCELALPASGPRPNIVVVVIDSLRADMLSEEVMPRTFALAEHGRTFADHLSGGNATRFGLFSLIYGLHGSYWNPVCHEHRSPVLVDALLGLGYDMRILTSASMDYPELRSTAWVRVAGSVEDRLPFERPGGRDDGVARRFDQWLAERGARATPFFAFLVLDAPHQKYSFPAESAAFHPYAEDIAYVDLAEGASATEIELVFNRYRNAVRYADETTGRILDSLADAGIADETLVVVTGDHGEEFFENGFWGHTSNFAPSQARVPLVLAGPGVPSGTETRPTSHIDLPATLLELLGADPALRQRWTLGSSLLDPPSSRIRVVAGWNTLGIHAPSGVLVVSMAAPVDTEVYDLEWRRIFDDSAILAREGTTLAAVARECRAFLR